MSLVVDCIKGNNVPNEVYMKIWFFLCIEWITIIINASDVKLAFNNFLTNAPFFLVSFSLPSFYS